MAEVSWGMIGWSMGLKKLTTLDRLSGVVGGVCLSERSRMPMVSEHKYDAGLWKRGWFYLMGCLSGFVLCGLGVAEEPVISEFLAANVSGLRDSDSEASDWIEIFNPSSSPVTLTGWCLTDDAGDLTKWRLPEVEVAGGGYLVVFASGKDRRDPGEELHTNFSLGRDGEYLALVRPDGGGGVGLRGGVSGAAWRPLLRD